MSGVIRETCGCGALWEGPTTHHEDREKFRAAHGLCRQRDSLQARLDELLEAVLAAADCLERADTETNFGDDFEHEVRGAVKDLRAVAQKVREDRNA